MVGINKVVNNSILIGIYTTCFNAIGDAIVIRIKIDTIWNPIQICVKDIVNPIAVCINIRREIWIGIVWNKIAITICISCDTVIPFIYIRYTIIIYIQVIVPIVDTITIIIYQTASSIGDKTWRNLNIVLTVSTPCTAVWWKFGYRCRVRQSTFTSNIYIIRCYSTSSGAIRWSCYNTATAAAAATFSLIARNILIPTITTICT